MVGAGRLHPALGPRPLRGLDHLRLALPRPGRRPGHPLGHPRPLRRVRLLLRPDDRAGQPLRDRVRGDAAASGRTRSCRTTRWWRSTRRSSTSGFVVFTVPFAFAIGMLATGRVGDRWQIECRRWTLVAFTFLSVGIVLGAWWSYQVLGWGGFWGWDPVENAALLPWLCGTAYLHSVAGPGAARADARLEPLTVDRHVRAHHPRHVPDPLGRHHLGARLLPVDARPAPHRVLLRRGHRRVRADRLARRPPALARRHRRPARPGGRLPPQQRAVRRLRLRRAARAPCTRSSTRRSRSSRSPSARRSSTRWPSRPA